MQHPTADPVPPVKQGCCLSPCRGRVQLHNSSGRGGATNRRGGGGGREDAGLPSHRGDEQQVRREQIHQCAKLKYNGTTV